MADGQLAVREGALGVFDERLIEVFDRPVESFLGK